MVEKMPTNTGSITVGKFELKYQIEGKGMPALVIGSAIYYPRTFSQSLRDHFCQAFITRALKFSPMIWYNKNFDAIN